MEIGAKLHKLKAYLKVFVQPAFWSELFAVHLVRVRSFIKTSSHFFKQLMRSLGFRVMIPLFIVMILLGISVYSIVFKTVSDFADQRFQEDLERSTRDVYGICDTALQGLLISGSVGNAGLVRIRKGKTLGEIESYVQKNQLMALVYSNHDILFDSGLPADVADMLVNTAFGNTAQLMPVADKRYYVRHFQFELWSWQILLLKEEKIYTDLTEKVQRAYLGTWVILFFSGMILVYYLNRIILVPIDSIITSIRTNESPSYRGAYEFEFLSENIAEMMRKQKQEQLEITNQAAELRDTQVKLMDSARQAGMAQVAINVLHNVGNALNSVNTSAGLATRILQTSKSGGLAKAVEMMNAHADDLGAFLTYNEKGKLLPTYLGKLADTLATEQQRTLEELKQLTKNVDHIKEIVATQQSYAGMVSVIEIVHVPDLLEDALRMNADSFMRHQVTVVKEYGEIPPLSLDKHRILLILLNLLSNAKQIMSGITDRLHQITLSARITKDNHLQISVKDEGTGIAPENLTRIFGHGFTTRKDGHGFGLHSCALAAKEMKGSLTAYSDASGKGATFTLEIPVDLPEKDNGHT
jgi:signal transduction histidine kinase